MNWSDDEKRKLLDAHNESTDEREQTWMVARCAAELLKARGGTLDEARRNADCVRAKFARDHRPAGDEYGGVYVIDGVTMEPDDALRRLEEMASLYGLAVDRAGEAKERIAALETQRDAFLADLRVLKPAIAYEMAPRAAITCNDGLMEDCFRLQSDMARNLKRERERRHEAEMLHGTRVADLEQHVSDLEKSLKNARASEKVWRDRVEQAAEALSDVLSGEVGRLDLLARIAEVKTSLEQARKERDSTQDALREVDKHRNALLERVKRLEDAATKASAELRHTFRPETRDWNLVARAIRILEGITTPNAGGH